MSNETKQLLKEAAWGLRELNVPGFNLHIIEGTQKKRFHREKLVTKILPSWMLSITTEDFCSISQSHRTTNYSLTTGVALGEDGFCYPFQKGHELSEFWQFYSYGPTSADIDVFAEKAAARVAFRAADMATT